MNPTGMLVVIPSRLAVGEAFDLRVKLRGELREMPSAAAFNTLKPRPQGPFNLNVQRDIQYVDDCLESWTGRLRVTAEGLEGPTEAVFDGTAQGVFPGDMRPIGRFGGYRFRRPGIHFVRVVDEASGLEGWSNAVAVCAAAPQERIWWGDPHWQTFFSDGIRCPEELYAFARDEAFLDFGAISDHMEALTERQWDYFQAVTNDFNEAGRFATLVGQEWTHHLKGGGAPGHRNIYVRGAQAPALRATDADCNTLEKLWQRLDELPAGEAIAIPHHTSNVVMGVDWEQGWNPRYEKAVEVYSVWGSSERAGAVGNPRPIRSAGGEMTGRHVVDALGRGYRFGFVGGGDIHDGRPGDELHRKQPAVSEYRANLYPQGFTAAMATELTRENIFDAMAGRRTYAATRRGLYLDVKQCGEGLGCKVMVEAAAEDGVREAVLVRAGEDSERLTADEDRRVVRGEFDIGDIGPQEYCYVRVTTDDGDMAWSSPLWGDGK